MTSIRSTMIKKSKMLKMPQMTEKKYNKKITKDF